MFTYNNKTVKAINFNGTPVKVLKYNGIVVWQSSSGYKVNWNQYIENYPSSISYYNAPYNATITLPERGVLNVKSKNGTGVGWAMRKNLSTDILGHILYYRIRVRLNSDTYSTDIFRQCMYDEGIGNASNLYTDENCLNEFADYTILLKQRAGYQNYNQIRFYTPTNSTATADYKECLCLDLTKMFGSGNEPYTVEDLEEWLEENKDNIDLYAYDQGTEREVTKPKWLTVPSEYTKLEYLSNINETPYLDLGFIPTQNTTLIIEASYPNKTAFPALAGCRDAASSNNISMSWNTNTITIDNAGRIAYSTKRLVTSLTDYSDEVLRITSSTKKRAIEKIDGTVIAQNTNTTADNFNGTRTMYLFAINGYTQNHFKGNIYKCQIIEGNELVRYLIPVKRNSDNELGMYDLVGGQFYTNAGGGSFIGGNPI